MLFQSCPKNSPSKAAAAATSTLLPLLLELQPSFSAPSLPAAPPFPALALAHELALELALKLALEHAFALAYALHFPWSCFSFHATESLPRCKTSY